MSVVGIDFGTRNCTSAVVRKGKLDVATNEASMRYTPNVVGFTFKKRETGESGKVQFLRNATNSIYGPKFILGRKFNDPVVQQGVDAIGACKWTELPNGDIGVTANYRGNQTVFTSEQLNACMLTNMKRTTEVFTNSPVTTCVVSCPGWWSHKQRKALLNSCAIADLTPLRVVNDLSAVAFNFGFYHPGKFDEKPQKVMFVSMGHYGFQCNVVEFTKLNCAVKGVAYDLSLGGCFIDALLADHFATRFNKKHGVDIKSNKRVMLKILLSMEAVKKTLNTNPQASVSQDCLYEGIDFADKMNKDEYMEILQSNNIPQRVVDCVKKCLANANTTVDELMSIEWVGSAMRMQALRDALAEFYGKPLSATMNAEEAVAMGCAILCARLSPTTTTRAYDLVELNSVPVGIHWRTLNDPSDKVSSATLFPAGYALPGPKARNSTFPRGDTGKPFEVELRYGGEESYIPEGCHTIGVCKIPKVVPDGAPVGANGNVDVRVKFRAEPHGTFGFLQADLIGEREETIDVPIEEEKPAADATAPAMETESTPSEAATETPAAEPAKPKTRQETRRVEVATKLAMDIHSDELTSATLSLFKKQEEEMRATEQAVVDALNAKNDLETFIYSCREKQDSWREFATSTEFSTLDGLLDETSGWLYGEGEDVSKAEYDEKKKKITDITRKIVARLNEWAAVPTALIELEAAVDQLRTDVSGEAGQEKYGHISPEEMGKVATFIADADKVVEEAKEKRKGLTKTQDPPVLSSDLKMRRANLFTNATKILSTPKPKPQPPAEPAKEETKMEEDTTNTNTTTDNTQQSETKKEEPEVNMDVD